MGSEAISSGDNIPKIKEGDYLFTLGCSKCFHENFPTVKQSSFLEIKMHSCFRNILLASNYSDSNPNHWEKIRFSRPNYTGDYIVCRDFLNGKKCLSTKNKNCSFPHTDIEKNIWTLEREGKINLNELSLNVLTKIGRFLYFCKICFFEHNKISIKAKDANECSSIKKHHWSDNCGFFFLNDSNLYPQICYIRNFRQNFFNEICFNARWHVCDYVDCKYAHNEIELYIWRLEKAYRVKGRYHQLEQESKKFAWQQTGRDKECKEYHCDYSQKWFCYFSEFEEHLISPDHQNCLKIVQKNAQWKHRSPPIQVLSGNFKLCKRPRVINEPCWYSFCTYAHSEEELQEWKDRQKFSEASPDKKHPFLKDLLTDYNKSDNESEIIQEFSEIFELIVSQSESITLNRSRPGKLIKSKWNITVKSKNKETLPINVGLLLDQDRAYFHLNGNNNKKVQEICSSSRDQPKNSYTVGFSSSILGEYEQWVVFDFGQRPVLVKKLRVTVESGGNSELKSDENAVVGKQPWDPLKYEIIKLEDSHTSFEKGLLRDFKSPSTYLEKREKLRGTEELSEDNYKPQMVSFLYSEEQACTEILLRYYTEATLLCKKKISIESSFGTTTVFAQGGELFARIELPAQLTDDTDGGRLILENVNTVYLKPISAHSKKVFEAKIITGQADGKELESVAIVLTDKIQSALKLMDKSSFKVEVQFKPDRLTFCRSHYAVSHFDNPRIIFPNFRKKRQKIHVNSNKVKLFEGLNKNQLKAAQMIIKKTEENAPPFLLFGPFGTGKTFTIATTIMHLANISPENKILICTRSNSAADLYIKEYDFSSFKTLRLYAKDRRVQTVDQAVKDNGYCLMTEDKRSFRDPEKSDVNNHQIIISTLVNSLVMVKLGLRGYFTHIFIDEAGQALENEALMAVSLANSKTRIILAGDHNQMTPKVYSEKAIKCEFHRSLLERLFYFYLSTREISQISYPHRAILTENYRSRKEILEFISNLYYTLNELKLIEARGQPEQPRHPDVYPLVFYSTKGQETLMGTSYQNIAEAQEIADRVGELVDNWPKNIWGNNSFQEIGILTPYASQVNLIRNILRKKKLSRVTVERVANVQGKQFRVIFISTVRTPKHKDISSTSNLGFLTDPKLLNTAFTRAKSLVAVVGSAQHLCSIGECSGAWINLIKECEKNKSIFPIGLSFHSIFETINTSHLNPNAKEFRPKQKDNTEPELVENHQELSLGDFKPKNRVKDKILIELEKQLEEENALGHSNLVLKDGEVQNTNSAEEEDLKQFLNDLLQSQSNKYKQCRICVEPHECFATEIGNDKSEKIKIPTRIWRGHALDGDIAVVEIIDMNLQQKITYGKVVGVLQRFLELKHKKLYCTLDEYDNNYRLLIPIDKRYPKLIWWARNSDLEKRKSTRKEIGIYEFDYGKKLDFVRFEYTSNKERNNKIFVAIVLKWGSTFLYPISVVVNCISPKELENNSIDKLNKCYGIEDITLPHDLNRSFPENWKIPSNEYQKRMNFTQKMVFTIDQPNSQDLDDAISIEKNPNDGFYHVDIHIADVDYFIKQGTPFDNVISSRGISNYPYGNSPIHMIPKRFSSNLCSLLPNKDRLAISVSLTVDQTGDIIEESINKSIIRSRKKFSYIEFEHFFDPIHEARGENEFQETARWLLSLAASVHKRRIAMAELIHPPNRDVLEAPKAHFIVEELMLMANSVVARYLFRNYQDCTPLRCQPPPSDENIQKLQSLETEYGIRKNNSYVADLSLDLWHNQLTEGKLNITFLVSDWLTLVQILESEDFFFAKFFASSEILMPTISQLCPSFRKVQKPSKYICSRFVSTPNNDLHHFSLNLSAYVHFTSPIRRYIDIVVHRLLKAATEKKKSPYSREEIATICERCNHFSFHSRRHEDHSQLVHAAMHIIKDPLCVLGVIVDISDREIVFDFPIIKNIEFPEQKVRLSLLKPSNRPEIKQLPLSLQLKWQEYIFSEREVSAVDYKKIHIDTERYVKRIPSKMWKKLWLGVSNKDIEKIEDCIKKRSEHPMTRNQIEPLSSSGEVCRFQASYKLGTVVKIQFMTEKFKGFIQPVLQLFSLTPKLDICLEHRRDPVHCFSNIAEVDVRTSSPRSISKYQKAWGDLVSMEGAYSAVRDNEGFTVYDMKVAWNLDGDRLTGSFKLSEELIERGIKFNSGDMACVRCDPSQLTATSNPDISSQRVWVGHFIISEDLNERVSNQKNPMVLLKLNNSAYKIFEEMLEAPIYCTVECIKKLSPCRLMEKAIFSVHESTDLVKNLCTGDIPTEPSNTFDQEMIKDIHFEPFKNNEEQKLAVKEALQMPFSMIQGPPGTGKTFVGAHIAHLFSLMNKKMSTSTTKNPAKVLYCGPSNKCIDVVTEKLKDIVDRKFILRIYSSKVENLEFPMPSEEIILNKNNAKNIVKTGKNVKKFALHHRIRDESINPYAKEIREIEKKKNYENLKEQKFLIKRAISHEIGQSRIVLCTCSTAGRKIIAENINVNQCIIDEAGMCQEPEWLIPLVATNPKQVVIIGDHKQLKPIITEPISQRLGLDRSIMERYSKAAMMLKTQYRMHESICEFPSQKFYEGELITARKVKERKLPSSIKWPGDPDIPLVFCHVEGKEGVLTVTTEEGSEMSKNNMEEVKHAGRIAHFLVVRHQIKESSIVVMTQYSAQRDALKKELKERCHGGISVRTVVESQGDEWDYVIFSTVRSLPQSEIEYKPGLRWQRRHLGFIIDEHQINVALTRARRGLCIIGNENLLRVNGIWNELLDNYKTKGKIVPAGKFIV